MIKGVQVRTAMDLLQELTRLSPRMKRFHKIIESNHRYQNLLRYRAFIFFVFHLIDTDANTKAINTNFTEVNNIRNIPVNKRVYLITDVSNTGKIKHIYNVDGLHRWFAEMRGRTTSPFTRRPVHKNEIMQLLGGNQRQMEVVQTGRDYQDTVRASLIFRRGGKHWANFSFIKQRT